MGAKSTSATGASAPCGVLIVDKPRGPTSHDVVARIRRAVKSRAVGHAGTLDPMATGVLVVAIGDATKLVPWLTAEDKAYEATVRLGVETDTLDAEGNETRRVAVPADVLGEVRDIARRADPGPLVAAALEAERCRTSQVPPAFSAIRINGERAHALARQGKLEEDLPPRATEVRRLDIIGASMEGDAIDLVVRVAVRKGYFVRSLARDLAGRLGTVGHLTALRRTDSGTFTAAEAVTLDAVSTDKIVSIDNAAVRALPVTRLDAAGARAAFFGQRVAPAHMTDPHPTPSAWLDDASHLVAVGEVGEDGFGRVLRGFAGRAPA